MNREVAHRIETLVRRFRPHLLHAHSPVLNAIPALRVGRRAGIPVVYEIRALWEDAAVDHGTTREGSLRYRVSRGIETYAATRAAHVVTICEGLRSELVARGLPPSRITVVPNGVDIEQFAGTHNRDAELARSLGLDGSVVLGFVGSFYGYEGLGLLVSAMRRILERRPDARLLLVGGGYQEDNLRRQAAELGIADRVVFTGRVPHDEVCRYYDLIDVLVYPRLSMRLTDLVTPLKPLEAMAQGALVAVSAVGEHVELARGGETAALFSPDDSDSLAAAVLELLRHPERWPEMRTRARDHVRTQHSWSRCANGYLDLYARLGEPQRLSA